MNFKESFSVIVDNHKADDYTESIAFMKSFGLKCDCVGWATIKLDSEAKIGLISEMKEKAIEKGFHLRCMNYRKQLIGDADWYFFNPRAMVKNDDWTWDDGSPYFTTTIKGYKIPKGYHAVEMPYYTAVSQCFVAACKELKLTGIDFMWVTDRGKYDAPAFFYLLPEKGFKAATSDCGDHYNKPVGERNFKKRYEKFMGYCKQVDSDGGHMELLAKTFDKFMMVEVPALLDKESAPETDFAYLKMETLIRKEAAEKLIEKGVLTWADLTPAGYFDKEKHDKLIRPRNQNSFMPEHIKHRHNANYEKWLEKKRPPFNPKEKDALSLMRRAKKESPEYYSKALKKTTLETLTDTSFDSMMSYYKISNGCAINDEIDILRYEDVAEENAEFLEELQDEEFLLEEMPELKEAVVFGVAANGDRLLLKKDGSVMRYDHEDPYLSENWDSLHAFFYEQIEIEG